MAVFSGLQSSTVLNLGGNKKYVILQQIKKIK